MFIRNEFNLERINNYQSGQMREGTGDPEGEGAIIELSKRIDDLRNDSNSKFNDIYFRLNHVETEIGKLRGDMNERFTT
jgi:hypothetical protein